MITPLDRQRRVDENSTRRLVNFMLASGVDGLFLLGTMGEGLALDTKEQYRLVETVLSEVRGSCPVVAGCSAPALAQTLVNAKQLEKLGVNALVVLQPPFFRFLSGTELEQFFLKVCEATTLPLIIYNNPVLTGNKIPLALMEKLMANPQFVGVKDSSSDFAYFTSLLALTNKSEKNFAVLQGDEMAIAPALFAGAEGVVPGIGSLASNFVKQIVAAAKESAKERALELQLKINELFAGIYGPDLSDWLRGQKEALVFLGIIDDANTIYYEPLSQEKRKRVQNTVEKWKEYLVGGQG